MAPRELEVFAADALADRAAQLLAGLIEDAVAERGRCRIGLAGGGTPRPVYERLAEAPYASQLPWRAIDWFWGDERAVPPDDEASNYALVQRALLSKVAVPPDNVHRMRGELPPGEAARAYEQVLGDAPLDVLLLGMGGDGHTASLFPGMAALANVDDRVVAATAPVAPFERISLGWKAINEARVVVLLVAGAAKAARLAEVQAQRSSDNPVLPAARIAPTHGRLIWLLDTEAATGLETSQ